MNRRFLSLSIINYQSSIILLNFPNSMMVEKAHKNTKLISKLNYFSFFLKKVIKTLAYLKNSCIFAPNLEKGYEDILN